MLGVCQRVAAIPMQTRRPGRDPLPRTRRDRTPAAPPAPRGPARAARPSPAAVPLQHRRAGAGSRRPAGRAPRPRCSTRSSACTARATSGAPARCGTRPRDCFDALLDSAAPPPTPQTPVFCAHGQALTRFGIYKIVRRHAADPRQPPHRSAGQPAHVPTQLRRSPARGRRRGQRHPRLARPRRPVHHQPLRRDQHQDETGSPTRMRAANYLGGRPPTRRSGDPTRPCSTGSRHSDRYVPDLDLIGTAPLKIYAATGHITRSGTEARLCGAAHNRSAGRSGRHPGCGRSGPGRRRHWVRSGPATRITTRYRHHANHATSSTTLRPATIGPSPKSYCSHSPGSVIQGRCTRVLPSRHWDLISASARRVVRSVPVYPSATQLVRGLCRRGSFPSNRRPTPPGRRANRRSSGPAASPAADRHRGLRPLSSRCGASTRTALRRRDRTRSGRRH